MIGNLKIQNCSAIKKNAVVVVAIGKSKIWDISRKTIITYCEKFKLPLEVLTEKKYDLKGYDRKLHLYMFEKNQIYDLFSKYNRILRLDWDVLITPDCPNLFDIVPEDKIGGVFEDLGSRIIDRRNRIKMIQDEFGDIGWTSGYLNAGILLASNLHKEIFNTKIEDIDRLSKTNLKVSFEQTYINYLIRKFGFEIFELSYKFNHMSMFSEDWNGRPERYESYIIHYAGKGRKKQLKMMKKDYNYIFLNKSKPYDLRTELNLLKRKNHIFAFIVELWKILINKRISFSFKLKKIFQIFKKYVIKKS